MTYNKYEIQESPYNNCRYFCDNRLQGLSRFCAFATHLRLYCYRCDDERQIDVKPNERTRTTTICHYEALYEN